MFDMQGIFDQSVPTGLRRARKLPIGLTTLQLELGAGTDTLIYHHDRELFDGGVPMQTEMKLQSENTAR
jgi:hypothetical protein